MSEHPDSPVKLPNLNVEMFDKLAHMLQRGGIIGRREVIAPDDLAQSYYERSIVCHGPTDLCFRSTCRVSCRCVNSTTVVESETVPDGPLEGAEHAEGDEGQMRHLSFAEYLERRRPSYTQESLVLEQLKQHSAFRSAVSSEDIETYLNERGASFGVRTAAWAAWTGYKTAKRKQASRRS